MSQNNLPADKINIQKAKNISLRLLVVAVIFLTALGIFLFIADEMVLENENRFDQIVFQKLDHITSPALTSVMTGITFFGSSYFLFPAYCLLILYFLFYKKNLTLSLDIVATGTVGTLILMLIKNIFQRHRPLHPLLQNVSGFSFPSGHSFSSFTFFGLLIYILSNSEMNSVPRWLLTVFLFLFAAAIAFSRVYLHVHYVSDVIGGFCLCLVWLTISFWALKKLHPVKTNL